MEDPQIFQELRLDLVKTIQSPLIHPADVYSGMMARFFLFFFWCLGTSSPELSIDELCCRFFGVVDGEDDAAVSGGDGLAGGASNGSGGGVPFSLVLKLTWEVVAWIFGVVWLVVVEWFSAVLVMKGWNEGALVVETISAPGPAAF